MHRNPDMPGQCLPGQTLSPGYGQPEKGQPRIGMGVIFGLTPGTNSTPPDRLPAAYHLHLPANSH